MKPTSGANLGGPLDEGDDGDSDYVDGDDVERQDQKRAGAHLGGLPPSPPAGLGPSQPSLIGRQSWVSTNERAGPGRGRRQWGPNHQ